MINGMINVYKEQGYTSHDVVAKLRGITKQKKIGHTGTLDPDAEGVLPVCLGKATKLCDLLTDKDKCYEAVLLLGKETDTQDVSGKVLAEHETGALEESKVRECVLSFQGEYAQIPPMYSALKVNGKKLYELAREGKSVERKARNVVIHGIEILQVDLPHIRMRIHCSKGTYIRTLCHDIGRALGCGGCMESLVRTRVSMFQVEESKTLSQIEAYMRDGRLEEILVPIDTMFSDTGELRVSGKTAALAYNGNPICLTDKKNPQDAERVRVYDDKGRFIGLYRYKQETNQFLIEKMFLDKEEVKE